MFQQIERAAKVGSILVNTTMLGIEVYKYFQNNGHQTGSHTEPPGAE